MVEKSIDRQTRYTLATDIKGTYACVELKAKTNQIYK